MVAMQLVIPITGRFSHWEVPIKVFEDHYRVPWVRSGHRRLFVARMACVLGVMEEIPAMVQDLDALPEGAKRDMHWRQPHAGKCRYLRN